MKNTLAELVEQAILPNSVRANGPLTIPRTYGVFEVPTSCTSTRRYRFGNYPIRQTELIREFGACKLVRLYKDRNLAQATADLLNQEPA